MGFASTWPTLFVKIPTRAYKNPTFSCVFPAGAKSCLEGKTILGKTIKALSPLKVHSLQKKQKLSRKDPARRDKGTAKKSLQKISSVESWSLEDFAGSLRLRVFACAFDFLLGCPAHGTRVGTIVLPLMVLP